MCIDVSLTTHLHLKTKKVPAGEGGKSEITVKISLIDYVYFLKSDMGFVHGNNAGPELNPI